MNNDAMIQLQNFTYKAILNSVIKIAEVRNIKIVSGQKKMKKGIGRRLIFESKI